MNLAKITRVAGREFASTAMTKGFIFGALVVPAIIAAIMPLVAVLAASAQPPADKGTVYVLDRSGEVFEELDQRLSPEVVRQRWAERFERAADFAKGVMGDAVGDQIAGQSEQAAQSFRFPEFRVVATAPDADPEEIKAQIRDQLGAPKDNDSMDMVLALVEIDPDAAKISNEEEGFGSYQAFFRPKLNEETVDEIEDGVRWSIRERRFVNEGMNRDRIAYLNSIDARESKEITEEGERNESSGLTTFLIPIVALILLLIASMTGGQYLLTTTIEEKSNRVVEVLLSACSPMELMTGKIIGQMGVGLALLTIYNSLGIIGLIVFNRLDLIDGTTIILFFVYFLLAYFMFASFMAAIGAAVNDLRESQSLMTPVMMIMMLPYFFFMPVIRSPNSMLSTVLGFVPPISPFIMIMRVSSTDPPPVWQVLASIAINGVAVVLFLWFAAKVFRVGLLMYGKPPNFRTLIRWIRMA